MEKEENAVKTNKKGMKMKRVKRIDEAVASFDEVSEYGVVHEVVASAGVVTLVDKESKERISAEATSTPRPRAAAKVVVSPDFETTDGLISTVAPINVVMEEVSLTDWQKSQASDLTDSTKVLSATQRVKNLIGRTIDEATKVMEDMKIKNQLSAWRVVPIGQTMTMDLQPGRVQLLVDAAKHVIDVQIS